ncbi:MAG: FAD-dependent oxidoreductase [Gammaproteobacteria bacterium]|nr:FAD-dependent oxidoreductase [Gammaproteobacteria bacterium]
MSEVATNQTILVAGGGISGMTAALEAAECGKEVVLVEKRAALGGRVSQLYKYFPKMCRPHCGQEINQRRIRANRRLRVLTLAEITKLRGAPGDYTATIKIAPRHVNSNCTACGDCASAVSAEIDSPHDYGMRKVKAAYLPHNLAWPQRYVIDASIAGGEQGAAARDACRYGAVDLDMREETIELKCGAVIFATGWRPYDAAKIQPYGYARYDNVVTSVEFERMLDPYGPTGGKLLRPSDGAEAKDVAFVQCAGSRDRNHLAHCSRVCCMASLKQSMYVGECYGEDARATIYYIDIRGIDRFEDFERQVRADERVRFVKSKVARIEQNADGSPVLHGVDTHGARRYANTHDLAVLAVGMQPSVDANEVFEEGAASVDASGFIQARDGENGNDGVFAAGCAADALDVNRSVQSATAAALRAIQVVNRAARA